MVSDVTTPFGNSGVRSVRQQAFNLFLVGFLVLFLELACIRWFSAYVVFLHFFSNVVLIAAFLGMSCGCLAARESRNWLGYFPIIALTTVIAALAMLAIYHYWSGLVVDIGGQASPEEVFFGTEYREPDAAQFVIPIEAIAAIFFLLIAFMFVGLGQELGRAFDEYPNRVLGYTYNIAGSLAGILAFSALSFAQAPPIVWFLISCLGIAFFLRQSQRLTRWRAAALVLLVAGVAVQVNWFRPEHSIRWSPYYMVDHDIPSGLISVDAVSHQQMAPYASRGSNYSLIHLLQQETGGKPFQDVLIIGAGSGNDVNHARKFGAEHIDAVEIDPVIQDIGIRENQDHPYQDPHVFPHLDDGRHFLRTTDRKYDLVVYALVDSLMLHSSYANIRLESFLFTREAFEDVKRVLKPDGTFVMSNDLRQGWIVERIAAMAESVFGCPPIVFSLPYVGSFTPTTRAGFTMMIAGCNRRIPDAFAAHPNFWLHNNPSENLSINGFELNPGPAEQRENFIRVSPATLVRDGNEIQDATDDWPFLYMRDRVIPDFTLRSMLMMGILGLGMIYFFLPKGRGVAIHPRMFFLGAAFMFLETKAVVQMALLFGSTWLVNSLVFFTVLVLIFLANLYVLKAPQLRLIWHYAGLFLFLVIGLLTPLDTFLGGGIFWRYVVPCVLSLGPMLFAGVIFAHSFRDAPDPDLAFGSNIAGSVVGGLCEAFSTLLGFRFLLLLPIAFYLLSIWSPRLQRTKLMPAT